MPAAPELSWDYGAVALLDVLGFSKLVEEDSGQVRPTNLRRLAGAFQEVSSKRLQSGVAFQAFSDTIVLSCPLTPPHMVAILDSVRELQATFLVSGILLRGGIAFGKHFTDANLIYSEALVRAYHLERDKARFPRVVVDPNYLDWYFNLPAASELQRSAAAKLLMRDRDGISFVHYLDGELLESHLALIKSYPADGMTPSVIDKLQWLAEYHNFVAGKHSGHRFEGPLVSGFQAYQSA